MGKGRSTGHSSRMDSMVVARLRYQRWRRRRPPPTTAPGHHQPHQASALFEVAKAVVLRPGRQSSWSPKFPFTVTPTITNPIIKALFRLRVSPFVSIFCWSA